MNENDVIGTKPLDDGAWGIFVNDELVWKDRTKEACEVIIKTEYINAVIQMYDMMHKK
jgi:hypothetical protein